MEKIYTKIFFTFKNALNAICKRNIFFTLYFAALIITVEFIFNINSAYGQVAGCTVTGSMGGAACNLPLSSGSISFGTAKLSGTTFYSVGTCTTTNPYTDLTSTISCNVTSLQSYTLTLQSFVATSSFGTTYAAWIDWNANGVFTDAGETIIPANTFFAANATLSFTSTSWTVPATSGNFRMRVAVWGGGTTAATSITPCAASASFYGEYKDFKVIVTPATPCSGTPASLAVSPTSPSICSSVSTNIALTLDASGYTYQWQESNASAGTYANVTGGSGGTIATFTTPIGSSLPFSPTYYRCNVTCTASGLTTASQVSTVNLSSFLNCYCIPSYAVANGGARGIVSIGIAAPASPIILNTSTVNNTSPYYTLYTGASPISNAGLSLSSAYVLAVKVGTQANALNNVGAWIDYNQNGLFETTEFIGSFANAAASSTTNINFTVPGTAVTGTTAMRIRHRYGASVTSADACTNFTGAVGTGGAGETEDYRLNITGAACSGTPTAGNVYAGSSGTNLTASVCANATTTMYATGYTSGVSGISLQWQSATASGGPYTNVVGGSGATSPNYTTAALVNGTLAAVHYYYKCLITCSNGGANSLQTTPLDITVNPTPSVTVNGSSAFTSSMCIGGTGVSLTAANAAAGVTTWNWLPNSAITPNNTSAVVTVTPAATVTYTVTATANTCTGTATAAITVNPSGLTVTPSAPIITSGGNVSLTASAVSTNGGITYKWASCLTLSSATGATITASPAYTNTYTVTAIDAIGCSATTTVTVIVNSGIAATVNCGYSFSYIGTGSALYAATSGGSTLATGNGLSMNDAVYPSQSIGFNFDFNGILYNTIGVSTNGFIWFGTGSVSATNYTPLSSSVGETGAIDGIVSVMGGDMIGLAAGSALRIATTGSSPNRIFTIEWNNVKVSPGASRTDYEIKLYESTNYIELCYNTAPYNITFDSWSGQVGIRKTTADFLNRIVLCSGSANWTASTGPGANTATCTIDGGVCSSFGYWPPNGISGAGMGSGPTYRYAPIVPTPQITASGSTDLCPSGTVNFTSTVGTSYQWNLNGVAISGATNQTLNGVSTVGNYTVNVPATGCTSRTSYITKVTNNSTVSSSVSIASSPSSPLCGVTSATFTATPTNGGCMPSYQWKLNGGNVGTNSTSYVNNALVAGDQVQVQMSSNALCAVPVPASSTVIINGTNPGLVTPSPVSNICPVATVDLSSISITDNNSTTGTYSYYTSLANANAGTNSISSIISSPATYYIRKTTASGCFGVTSVIVNLTACCVTGEWTGTTNTDWNTSTNWCGNILPTSSTDVNIPGSATNQPEVSSGAATCHQLTIADGFASVSLTGGTLSVSGDIINNGSFSHSNGTLILNGVSTQSIPSLFCYDVKIDNTAGVVITGDLIINNTLELFSGIISTGGNIITILNNSPASVFGFNNLNYINGRLIRYISINGSFDFPIGDATNYELATVTVNNLSPTFYLLGEYFSDNSFCSPIPNAGGGPYVNGSPITNLLDAGYWTISPDNQPSGGTYDIQLNEKGASNNPLIPQYCAVIKRDDCTANWQSLGVHSNATQSINGVTVTAVRTALTSFSDFGIGFGGSVLPVQLSNFTVDYCDDNINSILNWTTASELNCDFFDLEVSTELAQDGGFVFRKIGQVDGNGTSFIAHDYSFVDRELNKAGTRYYRLKEVDMNGEVSYSQIVSLVFGSEPVILSTLYPNPTNHFINYELISSGINSTKISITNLLGQEMFSNQLKLKDGINKLNFNVQSLSEGIYFININPSGKTEIHRKFEKYSE